MRAALRNAFRLQPSGPRLAIAVRSSASFGLSILLGWAAFDLSAGLVATIGAFTAVYASDRPYRYRAVILGGVAFALSLATMFGLWSQYHPVTAVTAVAAISMIAAFLCNALRVGPPGAYMFALACAIGTAIPTAHLAIWQVGFLVFAGGAISWLMHMAGALRDPRGPELRAVVSAARAVALLTASPRGPARRRARSNAARKLHDSWMFLRAFQPDQPGAGHVLTGLRHLNRDLHLLFAEAVRSEQSETSKLERIGRRAGEIAEQAGRISWTTPWAEFSQWPLGAPTILGGIREGLRPGSVPMIAALRVGVAVLLSAILGALIDLHHIYWAMAAAVLVVHEGSAWSRSFQLGIARTAGTLVGLVLAGFLLSWHPSGLWLVGLLVCLQFTIDMVITRNYALATIFITAIALAVGTGGHPVADVGALLSARGLETAVGCAAGLAAFLLTALRSPEPSLRSEVAHVLARVAEVIGILETGDVMNTDALRARRNLQRALFALLDRFDRQSEGTVIQRAATASLWPSVAATEQLGYRLLAHCWTLEPGHRGAAPVAQRQVHDFPSAIAMSSAIGDAVQTAAGPVAIPETLDFLRSEFEQLNETLGAASEAIQGPGEDQ